ncbi:MAG TPA: FAD-dependent oxidoreductase [Sumerlaeia bacterium]|nr:FAD-dependent oxidoreductase [Sumerlaeia bacterium]
MEDIRLKRRKFLASAGAGALGLATAAAPAAHSDSKPKGEARMREEIETDVLVVGAGAAGIPAAIAAARAGAKVVLVEEDAVPCGAPVDMFVAMPCGGPRTGIYREMVDRLKRDYPLPNSKGGPPGGKWFMPASYLAVCWQMLEAEKNLRLVCGARAVDAIVRDAGQRRRAAGAVVEGAGGERWAIRAKVTIDATGTGEFSALAGCDTMYGRDSKSDFGEPHAPELRDDIVQQCTWIYTSHKVRSGPAFDMRRLESARLILDTGPAWFHSTPDACLERDSGVYLHWGCAVRCKDTRDPAALAEAQREAFAAMERDHALLRENGYVVQLAPRLGVREVRRIVGEHVITENDLRSGKLPDDTIAFGTYGLDIWGEDPSGEPAVPGYGIPYRALAPKGYEGLLAVGKCMSGSHVAMSAYRVQPIVASAGQGAGVAAAMAAGQQCGTRDIEVKELRAKLEGMGLQLSA